jgi:hypothetical protein
MIKVAVVWLLAPVEKPDSSQVVLTSPEVVQHDMSGGGFLYGARSHKMVTGKVTPNEGAPHYL